MSDKPRLSSRTVAVLIAMHDGVKSPPDPKARAQLFNAGLCCYAEGWKLTKAGKDVARHLTGRV